MGAGGGERAKPVDPQQGLVAAELRAERTRQPPVPVPAHAAQAKLSSEELQQLAEAAKHYGQPHAQGEVHPPHVGGHAVQDQLAMELERLRPQLEFAKQDARAESGLGGAHRGALVPARARSSELPGASAECPPSEEQSPGAAGLSL
eukprot:COSAG03_NODE_8762_length_773_cov_1.040059_1_plen_147_part_00